VLSTLTLRKNNSNKIVGAMVEDIQILAISPTNKPLKLFTQILVNTLQCCIHYTDSFIDIVLCYLYYSRGNRPYFGLTLLFLLLPNSLIFILYATFKIKEKYVQNSTHSSAKINAYSIFTNVTFMFICSAFNLYIFVG